MKQFLTRRKEMVFLLGLMMVLAFAWHDLFSEQQENSIRFESARTIPGTDFSGRTSCEVPVPDLGKNQADRERDREGEPSNLLKKTAKPDSAVSQE